VKKTLSKLVDYALILQFYELALMTQM